MKTPKHLTMKVLAEDDRPREKLMRKGRATLSDAELLAILLRSGSDTESALTLAQRLLSACDNDLNRLAKLNWQELTHLRGIGEAKALSIAAAFELGRRRSECELPERSTVRSSKDAYQLLHPKLGDLPHEEFWVLYLNQAKMVVGSDCISRGGVAGTTVDVRVVLRPALDYMASGLILGHNHPSGQLQPSKEDCLLTNKINEAAKVMDVKLLDHLIIGEKNYFSFADERLL